MEPFRFNVRHGPDGRPNHRTEIAYLKARAHSPWLSPLEAAAMLVAIEMLRGHEAGTYEICGHPYSLTLLTLCLGAPFDVMHDDYDIAERGCQGCVVPTDGDGPA